MKTRHIINRNGAFTLLELLLVILVLVILAMVFLPDPWAGNSYRNAKRINCVNNLKEIGLAFKVLEGDHGDKYPMEIYSTNALAMNLITNGNSYVLWQTKSNELATPKILICPADTEHFAATNFSTGFSDANISYFFNLDAADAYPQIILSGDDNLEVNGKPVQPGILNLSTYNSVAWTKERHHNVGNIGLADGSVQEVSTPILISAISNAASPNRLVIP
jgi:type II secretory pathway pseudopilin PulG